MVSNPINLNDIPLFVEVARRKSFSLAAHALGVPASTLSRRVSELERSIGMPLLNRNTRRLGLTEAGTTYFLRCQSLVDQTRVAHEALGPATPPPSGVLRIAMSHSLSVLLLPRTIGSFLDAYPGIRCEFDLTMRTPDAAHGVFDVMLKLVSSGDPAGMFVRELASVPTYLYAAPALLKDGPPLLEPADLAHVDCLRTSSNDSDSHWDLYDAQGVRQRVAVAGRIGANNISAAISLCGQGLGVTRLPHLPGAELVAAQAGLQRVLPDWQLAPLPLYAVFPSSIQPARVQVFMQYLEAALAKDCRVEGMGRARTDQAPDSI